MVPTLGGIDWQPDSAARRVMATATVASDVDGMGEALHRLHELVVALLAEVQRQVDEIGDEDHAGDRDQHPDQQAGFDAVQEVVHVRSMQGVLHWMQAGGGLDAPGLPPLCVRNGDTRAFARGPRPVLELTARER